MPHPSGSRLAFARAVRLVTRRGENRIALEARIDTLERHATSLEEAVIDDTAKDEAHFAIEVLRRARQALAMSPTAAPNVERAVNAAGESLAFLERMSSIGRSGF